MFRHEPQCVGGSAVGSGSAQAVLTWAQVFEQGSACVVKVLEGYTTQPVL